MPHAAAAAASWKAKNLGSPVSEWALQAASKSSMRVLISAGMWMCGESSKEHISVPKLQHTTDTGGMRECQAEVNGIPSPRLAS